MASQSTNKITPLKMELLNKLRNYIQKQTLVKISKKEDTEY